MSFYHTGLNLIHLELTTRCNALCPMCPRTADGNVNPRLLMQELSLDDIQHIFPAPFLRSLKQIDLCGVFGEPLVATQFDEVLAYFRDSNPNLIVDIYTNGSLRAEEWWSLLPQRLGNGRVVFGLDGLEDTHAIYRQGTDFSRILANARAFIAAGGRAQWDYLVFRHNQHQVEQARMRARELGFEGFSVKVSGRFYKQLYEETPRLEPQHGLDTFPVHNREGEYLLNLELPTDPRYQNAAYDFMKDEIARRGSLNPYFESTCISCRAQSASSCFISSEGTVFPCCWTYSASKHGSVFGMKLNENRQLDSLLEHTGGLDAINAKKRPVTEIIKGAFFQAIAGSWQKPTLGEGKLKTCARMCGQSVSQFNDQFLDPKLAPGRNHGQEIHKG